MDRLQVSWSTGIGGTGLSTFYSEDATPATYVDAVADFFDAVAAVLPAAVSISVPAGGEIVDPINGALTGSWSGGVARTANGSPSATLYAAGTGCLVQWKTSGVADGHLVQGRTFIAPVGLGMYDSNGTLLESNRSIVATAAAALVTALSGKLRVWHRPIFNGTGSSRVLVRSGSDLTVTGSAVPDRVTSLRSRRR